MIVIGDDTSVQEMWVRGNHAEVTVTYRELERIDSSLRYSPSDPRIPKVVRRYQLIHAAAPTGTGESTAEIPGPRGWRISPTPGAEGTALHSSPYSRIKPSHSSRTAGISQARRNSSRTAFHSFSENVNVIPLLRARKENSTSFPCSPR
jgi:hypothetical protein